MSAIRRVSATLALALAILPAGLAAQRGARASGPDRPVPPRAEEARAAPDSTAARLAFLIEPQKRLRVELGDRLLELGNARLIGDEIRFDYAWDPSTGPRVSEGLEPFRLSELDAVYRRWADRTRGLLYGGLSGAAAGVLVAAVNDMPSGEAVTVVLSYAGVSGLVGAIFAKPTGWKRVYP